VAIAEARFAAMDQAFVNYREQVRARPWLRPSSAWCMPGVPWLAAAAPEGGAGQGQGCSVQLQAWALSIVGSRGDSC